MNIQTCIHDMNAALKREFQDYRGVYFFGSRTRDDYREWSDYDFVFVFDTPPDWRKKDRIRDVVYRKELEFDIVIDGKYYAQRDVEEYKTPFLETVSKEGQFYGVQ